MVAYRIRLSPGIMIPMTLFMRTVLTMNSSLTRLNRSSSNCSVPKALATRIPVSFSLVTRLISSSFSCIFRDSGEASRAMIRTNAIMTGRDTIRIIDMVTLLARASTTPPIHIIGAIRQTFRSIFIKV